MWYSVANEFFGNDVGLPHQGAARNIIRQAENLDYLRSKILSLSEAFERGMSDYRTRIFKGESPDNPVSAASYSELNSTIQSYREGIRFFEILIQSTYGVELKYRVIENVADVFREDKE